MNIDACLPSELRKPSTTITKVSAGLSGAGVYRVDAGGQTFVLKISDALQPLDGWRRALRNRQLASDAGLAARIVHIDESRRAVLSEFVVDQSFPAFYRNPATHDKALAQLGRTLRRVHDLPLAPDAESKDARTFLADVWSGLAGAFAAPGFVGDAVEHLLAEQPPDSGRPTVVSHNDVNPSNLVYDGENILLHDWETSGPNDPFYDLATVSLFLRMDEATSQRLLDAHDGEPAFRLPARFAYDRRLAAVMCCAVFLHLAHQQGHAGATGDETLESTLSLGDFYKGLMTGAFRLASAEGQWRFGLALLKEGGQLRS
jgi:aminoglycoside phosphotransferase (APT) family kinase protein